MNKKIMSLILALLLTFTLVACNTSNEVSTTVSNQVETSENLNESSEVSEDLVETVDEVTSDENSSEFTERDLEQDYDADEAEFISLESSEDYYINQEGVYVFTGDVEDVSIIVEVSDEDKVQLVLDGVTIVNEDQPAIQILEADKVFVTTTASENTLIVNDFSDDSGDGVIFSKSDLVINGLGILNIESSENGVVSKDDLKITGGTINIVAEYDGIEANDSIRIADGYITINSGKDALHAENDDATGYIFISGGDLTINAEDDAIRATTFVQIDDGIINIVTCTEGIEATYIQINGGTIDIYATDDGVNATNKSDLDVLIELNGGNIHVVMASGDTDAFDANGSIIINGGTIDVEGGSSFDADQGTTYNDGTVTVNGEIITDFSNMGHMGRPGKK